MKKRFISMLCAFSLALLLAVPISAANHSPIAQDDVLAISTVARDFDFESAFPISGYVDISSLWIGERIPTFEARNNSLYPLSISFYPILNESGVIIAHAMTSTVEGSSMSSISCQLVNSLNDFAKENFNSEFALIYDRDAVYAWCENEIALLVKNDFPIDIENRSYIEDIPTTCYSDIELARLTPATRLDRGSSCYGADDESAYVRVPTVKQTTSSNCWAACMASILSVELGGNYTCDDLNSLLPYSNGATAAQVKTLFSTYFNINYNTFTASASDLSFNLVSILNKLGAGHPLFGGFDCTTSADGHAMVIRGINLGSNTYSAMDPATASYSSGTIRRLTPSTGALFYAIHSGGVIYYLSTYLG